MEKPSYISQNRELSFAEINDRKAKAEAYNLTRGPSDHIGVNEKGQFMTLGEGSMVLTDEVAFSLIAQDKK